MQNLLSVNVDEIPKGMIVVAGLGLAKFGALYYLHRYGTKRWVKVGKISKLFIYPLKSCRGIEVNELNVTENGGQYGPIRDRHWMVIYDNGNQVTQRNIENLALISQSFKDDKLCLKAPGMDGLELDIYPAVETDNVREVSLFGTKIKAYSCGEESHRWICQFLERDDLHIVHLPPELGSVEMTQFNKPHHYYARDGDMKALHDKAPFMLMTAPSVDDVARRIDDKTMTVSRFRPNIFVDGNQPYDEDEWQRVQIGAKNFFTRISMCKRCIFTTVNQEEPNKANDSLEPLTTLRKYRQAPAIHEYGRSPILGVHLAPDKLHGTIKVGDDVFAIRQHYQTAPPLGL